MRTLACKDLGFDCDFEARGEIIHEVMEQMVDHIEECHLEEWARMEKSRKLDLEEEKDFMMKHIKDDERSPV